jgi:hypothetical protein
MNLLTCSNCSATVGYFSIKPTSCEKCGTPFPEVESTSSDSPDLPDLKLSDAASQEADESLTEQIPKRRSLLAEYQAAEKAKIPSPVASNDPTRQCSYCGCVFQGQESVLELVPCPTCGVIRPEAIRDNRPRWHRRMSYIGLFFILIGWVTVSSGAMTRDTAGTILAVALGMIGLGHVWFLLNPPGGNLEENRKYAALHVTRKTILVTQAGDLKRFREPNHLSALHVGLVALLMLAPLASLGALGLRMLNGWPINANASPYVVSPGDTIVCNIRTRDLASVGRKWTGKGRIKLDNANEFEKEIEFEVTTHETDWSNGIYVTRRNVRQSIHQLGTRVTIPADAALEGKTLRMFVEVDVTYPTLDWDEDGMLAIFDDEQKFSQLYIVKLAPQGASTLYRNVFGWGLLLAAFTSFVGGYGLSVMRTHPSPDSTRR